MARANLGAVQGIRCLDHVLVSQPTEPLAMLERERDVVCADLEHGRRTGAWPSSMSPRAWVEESGVVRTSSRLVGSSAAVSAASCGECVPLARNEEIEHARLEDQPRIRGSGTCSKKSSICCCPVRSRSSRALLCFARYPTKERPVRRGPPLQRPWPMAAFSVGWLVGPASASGLFRGFETGHGREAWIPNDKTQLVECLAGTYPNGQ